jgi:hypothetical protein
MVAGVLMDIQNPNVPQHAEMYQWSNGQEFVMEPAEGALGIFANTINKKQGDNVIKNTNTNNQFKMSDCRSNLIACNDSVFISTGFLFYYSFF